MTRKVDLADVPTHQEIADVENEFDRIETELIRYQAQISADAYAKRTSLVSRIPNFWTIVFENPPEELASSYELNDGDALSSLVDFSVSHFDLERSPRSFELRFTFGPNDLFEDSELVKRFWFRTGLTGWSGLVSEPVRIRWKEGKDVTLGLLDAAADLFELERKMCAENKGQLSVDVDTRQALAEHQKLKKMLHDLGSSPSFFTFFGFISDDRFVSDLEDQQAQAKEEARRLRHSNAQKGSSDEADDSSDSDSEDEADDSSDVEICTLGFGIATILLEDVWPNALKFYAAGNDDPEIGLGSDDEMDGDDEPDDQVPQLVKKRSASTSAGPEPKKQAN